MSAAPTRTRATRRIAARAMRAAVEDPATVVGVTTSLAALERDRNRRPRRPVHCRGAPHAVEPARAAGAEQSAAPRPRARREAWVHAVAARRGRRSRRLLAGCASGTARDDAPRASAAAARASSRTRSCTWRSRSGAASGAHTGAVARRAAQRRQAMARILWRYRGMLFNPRYGRVGLVDLPQLLFDAVVVPWLELVCLAALPFAAVVGVLRRCTCFS